MDILALIIAVVLIIYLMQVGFPRTARQLSASRSFLRFYVHRIISSWVLLGIAGMILLHDGMPLSSIGLLLPNPWWPTLLACIGVGMLFCLLLLGHLRAMQDEQVVARMAGKRRLALPRTPAERLAWVGVSINAGIWEEIVFRGFLPRYITQHVTLFGISLPFVWAALFSLILFSLGHLYQGWGGVLGVGFVGITLAMLYTLTGNLFASILWHTLFDVRFSFGGPAGKSTTPATDSRSQEEKSKSARRGREQKERQESEEDPSRMEAERDGTSPTDPPAESIENAVPIQADVRPRGRAAREQLLRDMGE